LLAVALWEANRYEVKRQLAAEAVNVKMKTRALKRLKDAAL
jgi:hypothetical protein